MVRAKAAKQRITRNYKFTFRRKAGFVIGGESVNYDDTRIKKAISYNWDLSNQFIVDATTPDKKPQKRKHTLETVENMPSTQKKAKKKPALSRKKPPDVKNDDNNAEVKQIQAMFADACDFQLMTEVVPKVNDQYVVKSKNRPRRRCMDHNAGRSTAQEIVNESTSTAQKIVDATTTNEIVDETIAKEDVDATTTNEIVDESIAKEDVDASTTNEIVDESIAKEDVDATTTNEIVDESIAKEDVDASTTNEIVDESIAMEIINKSVAREIVDESIAMEIINKSIAREIVNKSIAMEIVNESASTAQEIVNKSIAMEIVNESTSTAQEIVDENENIETGPFDEEKNLQVLLDLCEAPNVVSWDKFVSSSSTSFENCSKLGEGTYGEVFKISINDKECALKVIPFAVTAEEGNKIVNGDYLKPPMSTYNELLITRELSKLADEGQTALIGFVTHGFIRLIQFAIVKGFYPEPLLKAWDRYKIDRPSLAENQRPTEYATEDQHFILFALSNGGVDLESFRIQKQKESFSIFYQIAYSLAIAEEALEFEHRDLHIGNVLIDQCDDHQIIKFVFDGEDVNIRSCGVRTSIIDFTNSRIRKDELVVYIDLSEEEEIFNGQGDYQFDIYRLMRDANDNNWAEFKPKTNLLWLHYLSRKLFDIPRLFRKRRKPILEMFDKLLTVERVRDFLNDDEFLEEFADFRA